MITVTFQSTHDPNKLRTFEDVFSCKLHSSGWWEVIYFEFDERFKEEIDPGEYTLTGFNYQGPSPC